MKRGNFCPFAQLRRRAQKRRCNAAEGARAALMQRAAAPSPIDLLLAHSSMPYLPPPQNRLAQAWERSGMLRKVQEGLVSGRFTGSAPWNSACPNPSFSDICGAWVWVWVWDWGHTPPRPPPFTQYPSPSRSLVRDGQTSPHKPRLVVPHSTCPSLSPSPPAHSFIIGPAVINTHTICVQCTQAATVAPRVYGHSGFSYTQETQYSSVLRLKARIIN